jgi:hypothetical protein
MSRRSRCESSSSTFNRLKFCFFSLVFLPDRGHITSMGIRRARGLHYVVAVLVGVASGVAVFKEPLERERRRQVLAMAQHAQEGRGSQAGDENDPGEASAGRG